MQFSSAWLNLAGAMIGAVIVLELTRQVLLRVGRKWTFSSRLVKHCHWPVVTTVLLMTFNIMFYPLMIGPEPQQRAFGESVERVVTLLIIGAATWLIIQATYAFTDVALERLDLVEGERNQRARRMKTQITLVRRVATATVVVIAFGAMLFTFPQVRALGAGLLASAGIAGAVVGIAAQPTLGNMLAGLQLAFSDALRLDDVVVVQEEWGRIEELTLTYVVVRLWDERRLVLPVSYFTQTPFENWTRHGSRVLAVVYLRVDWSVPVEKLREELYRYLQTNPLWDQKDWTLQVTDIQLNGLVELRALMSAADSASAWDLKCDVREHLITYVRENHPEAMPRFRVESPETRAGVPWPGEPGSP
ncbi:mechanosensitive ion channel family protein [Nonomuraea sp. NPDC050478]|uniref:mechanosensitive ion channel family protein n=1 Tax=Nonomuraea sp. NPDC050478 TaxID=3364365 RepID=UPI0037B05FEA